MVLGLGLGSSRFEWRGFELRSFRLKEFADGKGAAAPKGRPRRPYASNERRGKKRIARRR